MKFNSVKIQFQFNENSISIQWKFNFNSVKIQFQFNENSISTQWKFNFNSVKIQFQFNENSISIQWKFIQCAKHLGWNIRESAKSPPAILADKMEESLRNLADSLGECSRLISQVLASSSSSSNGNVTDSVTQGVSGNNFSSTSNVSSAVERARSMLQRSRSTGLCSRLSQRERLRAASPSTVPSSSGAKKQKNNSRTA